MRPRKRQIWFAFGITTIFFIITRFILFHGFNGTDDLHYALLSARLTQHQFDPFVLNDIFSGRVLLIGLQASIYKLFGISAFSTQAGTVTVTVISCWLTVKYLLDQTSPLQVLLCCCLMYFNPVINEGTRGILPDAYIMLSGILVYLLIGRIASSANNLRPAILYAFFLGLSIVAALMIKETTIVFLPFSIIMLLVYANGPNRMAILSILVGTFVLSILAIGLWYQYFTGNFFFKLAQIDASSYINPCNFSGRPLTDLVKRLTFLPWQEFIVAGFYPIVFASCTLLTKYIRRIRREDSFSRVDRSFGWLLLFCLYFPFSLHSYQPLCLESRHFIMLIPFAAASISNINFRLNARFLKFLWLLLCTLVLISCVVSIQNKWQWLTYGMFTFLMVCYYLFRMSRTLIFAACFILVFGSIESLFFLRKNWFHDMTDLSRSVNANCFYFTDHDNMMNWDLLYGFRTGNVKLYSLTPNRSRITRGYDDVPDTSSFCTGWFIVNHGYHSNSPAAMHSLDSLIAGNHYQHVLVNGDLTAIEISAKDELIQFGKCLSK